MIAVEQFSLSHARGGAARAAARLHEALGDRPALHSRLSTVDGVVSGRGRIAGRLTTRVRLVDRLAMRAYTWPRDGVARSMSKFPGILDSTLIGTSADIAHLHWINGGALSLRGIGRSRKPIVWTMHDMWPIVGSLHYDLSADYQSGFASRSFLDLDRRVMEAKSAVYSKADVTLVAPSRWLQDRAEASPLARMARVESIPNALPRTFYPRGIRESREQLALPSIHATRLIGFGADGGAANNVKGWRFLAAVLQEMMNHDPNLFVVTFGGQEFPGVRPDRLIKLGAVTDDEVLAAVYSAVDVMCVPSVIENLPQTATEAVASGTPVVAFDVGGLSDVVLNSLAGRLVRPFDLRLLRDALLQHANSGKSERERQARAELAQSRWGYGVIGSQYEALYMQVLREGATDA